MNRKVLLNSKDNFKNFEEAEANKKYQNVRKFNFIKEFIIWLSILVATSIGPTLLINARYNIFFSISSIILLGICSVIYHFILKKLNHPLVITTGIFILYGYFIYFMVHEYSLNHFTKELFIIRLRGDGFFSISIIHLIWILIIIQQIFTIAFCKQDAIKIIQSSFEYWALIMISLLIIRTEILTNSGEGKVIIGNVFLLYGFFQQFIDTKLFMLLNNMVRRRLKA